MCVCVVCIFGAITLGLVLLDQKVFGFKNTCVCLASGGADPFQQKSMTLLSPLLCCYLLSFEACSFELMLVRGELQESSEV